MLGKIFAVLLLLVVLVVAYAAYRAYQSCRKGDGGVFSHLCHFFT